MHQLFTVLLFTNGLQSTVRSSFLESTVAKQTMKLPTVDEIRQSVKEIDTSTKRKTSEAPNTVVTKLEIEKKKEDKPYQKEDKEKAENLTKTKITPISDQFFKNPKLFVPKYPEKEKENKKDSQEGFKERRDIENRNRKDDNTQHKKTENKFKSYHTNKETGTTRKTDSRKKNRHRDTKHDQFPRSNMRQPNSLPKPRMDGILPTPMMFNPQIDMDGNLLFTPTPVRPYHRHDQRTEHRGARPKDQRYQGSQQNRNQDNLYDKPPPSYDDSCK